MKPAPQIVVIHGALGSAEQMLPITSELARLGTVHNVQLPGHGDTPLSDAAAFSITGFAESLRERISAIRAAAGADSTIVVFGYSMGGYVALALEASAPGTFTSIVTLGTKFAWSPALALRELSRLDPNIIQEKIPKFASMLSERHANAGGWKLVLERTGKLLTELSDKPILNRETLAQVHSRVTVAVGSLDDTVNLEEAIEYASFMPHATARSLADVPHPIEKVPVATVIALIEEALIA